MFQYSSTGRAGSGFGSWKTVLAVPVPLSVLGKTVPTVPVSGSSSVPEPPCFCEYYLKRCLPFILERSFATPFASFPKLAST